VSYNSEKTIIDTIESVMNQNYSKIEYIVIDGNSTDGTVELLKSYGDNIDILISEPDNGIWDALNKGIKNASGDLIGFVHSDDILASSTIIEELVNKIKSENADAIYGDLNYVDAENTLKIIRRWHSGNYNRSKLKFGWMPPHPTLYVKRFVYEKFGNYDESFGTAADYEFMIRVFYKNYVSCTYLPQVIVNMKMGGISNKSLANRISAHINDWKTWIKNDGSIFPVWVLMKPIRKLPQYFK